MAHAPSHEILTKRNLMFRNMLSGCLLSVTMLWFAARAQAPEQSCPLKFHIKLGEAAAQRPVSGRLFVFMTSSKGERQRLGIEFIAGDTWVAATEIESLSPGHAIEFDPDVKAYPKPFSQAAPGDYQVMALLDPDHSYPYTGQNEGDLYSNVVNVQGLNPAHTAAVELTIDRRTEGRSKSADTGSTKLAEFESPVLSRFWGRAIMMQAGVVLPPSFSRNTRK